jgi:hypothetical protein
MTVILCRSFGGGGRQEAAAPCRGSHQEKWHASIFKEPCFIRKVVRGPVWDRSLEQTTFASRKSTVLKDRTFTFESSREVCALA